MEENKILEEESNKISIKIQVADRYYPLKIKPADEEHLRMAAKKINERITVYQQSYKNRDVQDALSISILQFVMKLIELDEAKDISISGVQQLDKELGEYLLNNVD